MKTRDTITTRDTKATRSARWSAGWSARQNAQLSSLDAIIAVAIIVIILLIYLTVFTNLINKPFQVNERNDLETVGREVSTLLLASGGAPTGWHLQSNFSAQNVTMLGLSDREGHLDMQRILKLKSFTDSDAGYAQLKEILGLGKSEIAIIIEKNGTFHTTQQGFLNTNSRIAYTRGKSNGVEGNGSHFGLKDFLQSNNISFTDYDGAWETLITDLSQFDSTIWEDPAIKDQGAQGLSSSQRNALRDWVSNGGIYIQKESGTMIQIFGVSTNSVAHEEGLVIALDGMIRDLSIGDYVAVEEGYRLSKNSGTITTLIQHESSGHTIFGYWDYGAGRVYYIPDTEGEVSLPNGTITHTDLRSILALYSVAESGYEANNTRLVVGREPVNASEVVVVSLPVLIEDDEDAQISVRTWIPN